MPCGRRRANGNWLCGLIQSMAPFFDVGCWQRLVIVPCSVLAAQHSEQVDKTILVLSPLAPVRISNRKSPCLWENLTLHPQLHPLTTIRKQSQVFFVGFFFLMLLPKNHFGSVWEWSCCPKKPHYVSYKPFGNIVWSVWSISHFIIWTKFWWRSILYL